MAKRASGKRRKELLQDKRKDKLQDGEVNQVQRTFYELTITNLNRKLARLRSLNIKLEDNNEDLNKKLSKENDDRKEASSYLKRVIQEKTVQIEDLKSRIHLLKQTCEETKEFYTKIVQQLEGDYKLMHEQLTTHIKVIEHKLNTSNEFKMHQESLLRKVDEQEIKLVEQEELYKKNLYEIEKKLFIAKDVLKKELEKRLLKLTTDFQDATELRISATTHRIIRENISINNELSEVLGVHRRMYTQNENMKAKDRTMNQEVQLHCMEKNKALAQVRVLRNVIRQLSDKHESIAQKIKSYKFMESEMIKAKKQAREAHNTNETLEHKVRILEQNIHAVKCEKVCMQTEVKHYKTEVERLEICFLRALGLINKAQTSSDKTKVPAEDNLINNLLILLMSTKDEKTPFIKESLSSINSIDQVYKKGDLGFTPPKFEPKSFLYNKRHMDSQTSPSLIEVDKKTTSRNKSRLVESKEQSDNEEENDDLSEIVFFEDIVDVEN